MVSISFLLSSSDFERDFESEFSAQWILIACRRRERGSRSAMPGPRRR